LAVAVNQRQFNSLAHRFLGGVLARGWGQNGQKTFPLVRELLRLTRDYAAVVNVHFDGQIIHRPSLAALRVLTNQIKSHAPAFFQVATFPKMRHAW